MNIREYLKNKFENKLCQVLGFGRSNKPLVLLLLEAGARVCVRDQKYQLDDEFACSLHDKGVEFVSGENYLEASGLDSASIVEKIKKIRE